MPSSFALNAPERTLSMTLAAVGSEVSNEDARELLDGLAAIGRSAFAQAQPETLRIITGFAPGGTSDTICRRVAAGETHAVSSGGDTVRTHRAAK